MCTDTSGFSPPPPCHSPPVVAALPALSAMASPGRGRRTPTVWHLQGHISGPVIAAEIYINTGSQDKSIVTHTYSLYLHVSSSWDLKASSCYTLLYTEYSTVILYTQFEIHAQLIV